MPETKPFMSTPNWATPRYGGKSRKQVDYYEDMRQAALWFYKAWRYPLRNRSIMRFFKITIIFALFITCIINLKIAIEAKVRYEQHKILFADPIPKNTNTFHHIEGVFEEKAVFHDSMEIGVVSSKDLVEIKLNDTIILSKSSSENDRGLHVVTLNQLTGAITASQLFDTYLDGEDDALLTFLNTILDENRIVIIAVKDEASFHLGKKARELLKKFGSTKIDKLQWRSMWAIVTNKKGHVSAERLTTATDGETWADEVRLKVVLNPFPVKRFTCSWPSTAENKKREEFCSKFDGYQSLCDCDFTSLLPTASNFSNNLVYNIPVAVIASNRPHYLYRTLSSLLSASGANPSKITVFIDGHFEEPMQVTKLFGVQGIFHTPVGVKNARISQNYLSSLSAIFGLNPSAEYAIILEDDLDVSPDFFKFFSQTLQLLEMDPTIYCVSAWNDQGYGHSCQDSQQLYRVETFPGLGWMLSRKLFKEELEPDWPEPDKPWDWDMWMRQSEIRKGRECIIPDVSRTFHFGTSGVNMNKYFHDLYFKRHKINNIRDVDLKDVNSLIRDNYEKQMHQLVRQSALVDHTKSPCGDDFMSDLPSAAETYVVYLKINTVKEIGVFQKLFKCLKTWDLDVRGLHKYSYRTYVKSKHVVFIGYPVSPYSIYKPVDIEPIAIIFEDEKHV